MAAADFDLGDLESDEAPVGWQALFGRVRSGEWPALAGVCISAVGVIVVALGWYGAAHTTILQYQVPYLISGGMLGAALIVLGGVYSMTSTLAQQQQRIEDLLSIALGDLDDLPEDTVTLPVVASSGPQPTRMRGERLARTNTGSTAGTSAVVQDRPDPVMWVRGGAGYHRLGCQIVEGKPSMRGTVARAKRAGLAPCRICDPPGRGGAASRNGR